MIQSIVFFGTGPVAAKSLELLQAHQKIEAVITKPKPPGHRGSFPVLEIAEANDLPVIEVTNKHEILEKLQNSTIKPNLAILIDFGIIIDQATIDFFPLGIINSHFSRLPQWRGADPISFSILSGQPTTAVSLMLVDKGMDTGKLLKQESISISVDDTTPSLTKKLISLSDNLLKDTLPRYQSGEIQPKQQPHPERATYSRKLTKEDGKLDWTKPADVLEREVRAYADWPKSYTELVGKNVVITATELSSYDGKPGSVVINNNELHICCGSNSLRIVELKPAGKNEMTAEGFLAGHRQLLTQ